MKRHVEAARMVSTACESVGFSRATRRAGRRSLRAVAAAAVASLAIVGVALTGNAQAQGIWKDVPARVEMYPIPSLTLSDRQFLSGDDGGKPVTVVGELRVAQGSGRLPVVVLMHGSGGVGANIAAWSRTFNAMGISTFAIDGFTGRGITTTSTNQAQLGRLNLIMDIYRSLDVLAKHPRVDPERIVLMGFSRGGQAALYASLERFHKRWNHSGVQFAAYIPFYPDCATTYLGDTDVAARPIRIFHGGPDDYNPVRTCKAYVERLKAAGRDVELTEYPDSPHGFDLGLLGANMLAVATKAQTVRNCHIKEGDGGVLMNADTQQPFTYQDACVELDPHVGGNPATAEAARQAVTDFLRALLKLS
ncbi:MULTISPECIES: dienelactone hydrolase family protein [unclassified Bradyrhizobium]|uniref:dienelactone hydrolase family protein n=1 Tax=unclassified Bradyrhizobium TaxID=2631580 RepID=UPI0028E7B76D|nr:MULTISPECIES: dienelactone hydrolase family protein [unclassified Bradyrhizobium]